MDPTGTPLKLHRVTSEREFLYDSRMMSPERSTAASRIWPRLRSSPKLKISMPLGLKTRTMFW